MKINLKKDFWTIGFMALFVIQLLLIIVFNLTRLKNVCGFDSSSGYVQAMEIWNQKSLFLKDWDYQTTLGIDMFTICASVLYGITKNVFLAYGINNCISTLIILYVFNDILKQSSKSKLCRIIACVMLLTPYSLEPLGYMPMMFTNIASYSIKILIPLIMMDIYIKIHNKSLSKKDIPLLVFFAVSSYFAGLSSGLYIFICGVFPILVYELVRVVGTGSIKNIIGKPMQFVFTSMVLYGAGYITASIFIEGGAYTDKMMLCQAENFMNNVSKCLVGIAELFGALPYQDITITSAFGIHYLAHMAAFIIFVIVIIATIKKVRPFTSVFNGKDSISVHSVGICVCVIIVNLLVLILTNTTYNSETFEYRYHIFPVVFGFIIAGIGFDNLFQWVKGNGKKLLLNVILGVVAVVWVLSNVVFYYYFKTNFYYDTGYEIVEESKGLSDCNRIYFVAGKENDEIIDIGRVARLVDPDLIVTYGLNFGEYVTWGSSTKNLLNVEDINRMVVVCSQEAYNDLDSSVASNMKLLGAVDGYNLYEYQR